MSRIFESETDETIHERMLEEIDDSIDKRQGSVAHDLTRPAAAELAQAYIYLDDILTFGFASEDMPGEFLDLRARELGVYRKPSVEAVGELTFTGDPGTFIEQGTRARTDDDEPIYFETTDIGTIGESGSVTVPAIAEDGGYVGNVSADTITVTLGDLSGTVEVINAKSFGGGADIESDESLLERYFDRTQKPITSGNIYHYEQWAKEVPGVGDVKVYPIWNGAGTVKVVLLDEQKKSPDQSIIEAATEHIEEFRPIGADVTVVGADEIYVDISAKLVLSEGVSIVDVKSDIEKGVSEYLSGLAFVDPVVRYTQIASVLLSIPSILDYENLIVNGGTSNFEVADAEVALLGEVNVIE